MELTLKGKGKSIMVNFYYVASYIETAHGTEIHFNAIYHTVEEKYKDIQNRLEIIRMGNALKRAMYE